MAITVASSTPAYAGGFQLSVETPASTQGEFKDVVLLVRTFGCHQPADAGVAGRAEGIVNGERQSIPLELNPTSATGVLAIKQQWPAEGKWVLTFSGTYHKMTCSVLVELGERGRVRPGTRIEAGSRKGTHTRAVARTWTSEEIDLAIAGSIGMVVTRKTAPMESAAWPIAGAGAAISFLGLSVLARRRFGSTTRRG
jgi:hypothetical protein